MKKLISSLIGLTLLASTSVTYALDLHVKRNGDIVQVCNKETLGKNYKGDTFFHYRKEADKWVLDYMVYAGDGRFIRTFISNVTEKEIPTYIHGIYSLYYDKDKGEENLVAIFDGNINSKVKSKWIELAKEHIKKLDEIYSES